MATVNTPTVNVRPSVFTPENLAQGALVGSIYGLVSGAVGSFYSARSQRLGLRTQAAIDEANARIAELGAQSELRRGQREEQSSRLRTAQLKSRQRVGMAANGIDASSATALNILTTTDYMGEVDAQTIRDNAIRSAWGYRTQASSLESSAVMRRANASAISPIGDAYTSLLGNAGNVASSWYFLNKSGALKGSMFEMT